VVSSQQPGKGGGMYNVVSYLRKASAKKLWRSVGSYPRLGLTPRKNVNRGKDFCRLMEMQLSLFYLPREIGRGAALYKGVYRSNWCLFNPSISPTGLVSQLETHLPAPMVHHSFVTGLLALALAATPTIAAQFDPYYANLTWEAPRTLSVGSNLTVKTETGTFIGLLNDTYPNVRQFLRVPFAEVSSPFFF
jgi:hypothetical protein